MRSAGRITGALFLSGTAALLYQVLWAKQLTLVVGIQVYSITVAVSAFFAGLATGSAVFGRVADRVVNPARLYAFLEVLIAVFGVTATLSRSRILSRRSRFLKHTSVSSHGHFPFCLSEFPHS